MRVKWFSRIYATIIAVFTVYILLDTFVISKVYSIAEENFAFTEVCETAMPGTEELMDSASGNNFFSDENHYQDEHIAITISEYRQYESTIYVADVLVSSPEYLKTAFAQNAYGKNVTQKTSEIARDNEAILAINGDYYGSQEKGYVLRNGVLFRESASRNQEDLVIWNDGSFSVITEGEISPAELLENGAQQILSFGPALLLEGTVCVTTEDEVGKAKASNPRTAIGIVEPLHYLFVVSDGRTEESRGLTLYELAEFMQSLGTATAYNLDGGGSSTLYFNGQIMNNPTSSGKSIKERKVSDIVYIGY